MKTIVVYSSKTGFTEKYARWLQQDLNCDCVDFSHRAEVSLADYQAIAFGAGVYVGRIRKLAWLKRQLPAIRGKRVAVFFTAARPPDHTDIRRVERENFQPEELRFIRPFYLQGGLNYAAMSPTDKLLMAVFRKMLKARANSPKEKVMLQNVQCSFDKTAPENLKELKEFLTSHQ